MGELKSHSGNLLHYQGDPRYDRPVVTGEDDGKWYSVFVVQPVSGRVDATKGEEDMWQSSHIPHPGRMCLWADKNGYAMDPVFMAIAVEAYNLETDRVNNDDIAIIGPFAHQPHVYYIAKDSQSIRLEPEQVRNGFLLKAGSRVTAETEDHNSHEFTVESDVDVRAFLYDHDIRWDKD
ncbi:hypothetical protein LCGC14_0319970 [marine sediment metagenome]|uniref:Uncharacterized protein n=1 Tax=marine sediment metagenome TaxID=412755 RepID=A0A0F9TPZ7_9ZZZZ